MKFRKKPVVIDAIQWDGIHGPSTAEIFEAFGSANEDGSLRFFINPGPNTLSVNTLEGTMIASPGDYIIKGVKGEFYPCKPDIFEATYERVEE